MTKRQDAYYVSRKVARKKLKESNTNMMSRLLKTGKRCIKPTWPEIKAFYVEIAKDNINVKI